MLALARKKLYAVFLSEELPPHHHRRWVSNLPLMARKRREQDFERLVEEEKAFKRVMALKEILLKEPEQVILVSELRYFSRKLRLKHSHRFKALIKKYPAVFETYVDEEREMWLGLAPQAEVLVEQERRLIETQEAMAVQNIRKLLMMSLNKRLHVHKIAHLHHDLGFPADFQSRMVFAYPEYFKVVKEKEGDVLVLTSWDQSLAITALERRAQVTGEANSEGEPLFKMCVKKALTLSHKQKAGLEKFQERPFISPYVDSRDFDKNTLEFEKRQVALLHEILSMTLEKKTLVDFLTHFQKEYRLPRSIITLLLRHHSIFYVSRKGARFNVFLKEAYEQGKLIEKPDLILLKEKFRNLMTVGRGDKQGNYSRGEMPTSTDNSLAGSLSDDDDSNRAKHITMTSEVMHDDAIDVKQDACFTSEGSWSEFDTSDEAEDVVEDDSDVEKESCFSSKSSHSESEDADEAQEIHRKI